MMKALEQYLIPTMREFVRKKEGIHYNVNADFGIAYVTRAASPLNDNTKVALRKIFTILHTPGLSEAEKALIITHSCRRGMKGLNTFWWGLHRSWILRWATGNIDKFLLMEAVETALDNWTVTINSCIEERELIIQKRLEQLQEEEAEEKYDPRANPIPLPKVSVVAEGRFNSQATPIPQPRISVVVEEVKQHDPRDDEIARLKAEIWSLRAQNEELRDIVDEVREINADQSRQIQLLTTQTAQAELPERAIFQGVGINGQLRVS